MVEVITMTDIGIRLFLTLFLALMMVICVLCIVIFKR